jgi:hypothetical protein
MAAFTQRHGQLIARLVNHVGDSTEARDWPSRGPSPLDAWQTPSTGRCGNVPEKGYRITLEEEAPSTGRCGGVPAKGYRTTLEDTSCHASLVGLTLEGLSPVVRVCAASFYRQVWQRPCTR